MTSVWRSIPALKQSLDAGFHQLKDIVVLRQSHEDRLGEIAAEVERYEDILVEDGTITQELAITWTMVNGNRVRAQLVVVKDTHQIRPLCEACTKERGRDTFHGANYKEGANKFGSTMYVNDAA
eukprot:jgi/Tetstr1/463550/TSEL_008429.t1